MRRPRLDEAFEALSRTHALAWLADAPNEHPLIIVIAFALIIVREREAYEPRHARCRCWSR